MLKKLRDNGYIIIDENNHLHLTDEGMKIATKIYERHKILTAILKELGVSDEIAEEDACKIEHDLSDETWDKVRLYYKNKIEK